MEIDLGAAGIFIALIGAGTQIYLARGTRDRVSKVSTKMDMLETNTNNKMDVTLEAVRETAQIKEQLRGEQVARDLVDNPIETGT